jgi:hypothetical protein
MPKKPSPDNPASDIAGDVAARAAGAEASVGLIDAEARVSALANAALARPFLPGIDLVDADRESLSKLSDADKAQVLATKAADVTHFRVGLATLHKHAFAARQLAREVRILPKRVKGIVLNSDRTPAARVSVQPTLANGGAVLGRGVLTDEFGVFTLALPDVNAEQRKSLLADGLGLRMTGAGNQTATATVEVPASGRQAIGEIVVDDTLRPLPSSIVAALMDLVDDLPAVTPSTGLATGTQQPVRIQIGQDACNIVFEEDTNLRRFPYKVLVRLIEPRTTTVNQVFFAPSPADQPTRNGVMVPNWNTGLLNALQITDTRFVERLPVDKPISVDGFRDQLIGVENNTIGTARRVPIAGTLGLGYMLNLAQVWKYDGLTLGNLLYSLPLAPGEQQRIVVSERVATASVMDSERLDIAEQQHSSLREDASTSAVFESAFQEHVNASSSYRNEARSSSWGVAGGIGAVLGPVAFGIGAGGGGGSSSNNGSTRSALDGVRTYTSSASEEMHRSVERQASARRSASRTAIRLAKETDRETVTTKVITNHNKMHALTMQYWEVLRKFMSTTEVEGCNLVCFVPLDLVRFLGPGQPLELINTAVVDTRAELLVRYSMLHRHADAIQPSLPGRHREGMRILEDFAANPRATVNVTGPAASTLTISLTGRWIAYEKAWVNVLLRSGRKLGPVMLDSPLTVMAPNQFGTRSEFVGKLKQLRNEGAETQMTGSLLIPQSVDPSEIVAFEIRRAFDSIDYQLDPTKNPKYIALKPLLALPGFTIDLSVFESSVQLSPGDLERELGGPTVRNFQARLQGTVDSLAADTIGSAQELPPSGLPIPAVERNPVLGFRDIMKIERTLQHVVRNTLTYSKAVWSSLTPEERVVMLEGYTIGLPEGGLDAAGLTDASQHVPLLNCIANQVMGYYGNCMVMPFSIPASLAVLLNGDSSDEDVETREPLTTAAVQEALTQFHREAFSPPESHFTLPTRGVLGEAVLGHCSSAEKIDLTRFWNWQDSPTEEATAINNVALRSNSLASLQAPNSLSNIPTIINNVAEGSSGLGTLAQALAGKGPTATDFSTDFLGQNLLTTLGGKTIDSAESARKDALGSATQLAGKALDAGVDVFKTKFAADKAADEKKATEAKAADEKKAAEAKAAEDKAAAAAKAKSEKQDATVSTLKANAPAFLGAAGNQATPEAAAALATNIIKGLNGEPLPPELAARLFDVFDKKDESTPPVRTPASTAWLTALGLL